MSNTIRWNIAVSQDTDQALRMFLTNQGSGRKGDLSPFVEKAVRTHILKLTADQVKELNASVNEGDLSAIVEEAIKWARNQ